MRHSRGGARNDSRRLRRDVELVIVRLQLLQRRRPDQHGHLENPRSSLRVQRRHLRRPSTPVFLRLSLDLGVDGREATALPVHPRRDLLRRHSTAELRHDGSEDELGILQPAVLLRELGGAKAALAEAGGRLPMDERASLPELLRRLKPNRARGVAQLLAFHGARVEDQGLARGRPANSLDRRGRARGDGDHGLWRAPRGLWRAHVRVFPG